MLAGMPGQIVSWVRNEKIRFQRPRAGALAASFWGASQGSDPPQSEKEIFRRFLVSARPSPMRP
ncbi:MAG: hypothetical protein DMG70_10735 [Acidobacteria bacterium]|nr:MAG: hypothetical protein DMG70_10735 [Acidobacteriota bacterium]